MFALGSRLPYWAGGSECAQTIKRLALTRAGLKLIAASSEVIGLAVQALLVAGSTYSTTAQPSSTGSATQFGAGSLLSQALNQQMGSRLDRIFGSGHIRIDMQNAGFDRPANANVAFEQHIKDNLTLLYVTNVTSAQQRIIQAELTLSPRFAVTAIRDQNGLIGVNFQISLRFR